MHACSAEREVDHDGRRRQKTPHAQEACLRTCWDPSWRTLDVSGCSVSDGVVEFLVDGDGLGALRALDVRRTPLSGASLRRLISAAPRLELLRVGGCPVSDAAARAVLPVVAPRLRRSPVAGTWEEAELLSAVALGAAQLHTVVWPEADAALMRQLHTISPRLALITTAEPALPARRLAPAPEAAGPRAPSCWQPPQPLLQPPLPPPPPMQQQRHAGVPAAASTRCNAAAHALLDCTVPLDAQLLVEYGIRGLGEDGAQNTGCSAAADVILRMPHGATFLHSCTTRSRS